MQLTVEARPGSCSVVQCHLARALERAGAATRTSAPSRAHRRARPERPHPAGRQGQRQRRRASRRSACDLSGLDRHPSSRGRRRRSGTRRRARCRTRRNRLEPEAASKSAPVFSAALDVRGDGGRGVIRLRALQASPRASASVASARPVRPPHPRSRELRECARREIVAGGARHPRRTPTTRQPCRGGNALGRWVVVHERRHVHELDGDRRRATAPPGRRRRKTSSGRSRFPPAASASFPTAATRPGWLATDRASRSSSASRYSSRPSASRIDASVIRSSLRFPRAGRRYRLRRVRYRTRSNPQRSSSAASSCGGETGARSRRYV